MGLGCGSARVALSMHPFTESCLFLQACIETPPWAFAAAAQVQVLARGLVGTQAGMGTPRTRHSPDVYIRTEIFSPKLVPSQTKISGIVKGKLDQGSVETDFAS